jgi:CRP-like cAMP-binding protein
MLPACQAGQAGGTGAGPLRAAIAALPTFAGVTPAQTDALLAEARSLALRAGAALFRQGEEAQHFYVLLAGHLRVAKVTPDGRQVLVRFMHPGDPCGIAVAMGWRAYPATATAVVDCLLVGWLSSAWPRLAQAVPALSMNLMQSLGPRLNDTQARVMEMSTEPVEQRLAHALLRLAARAGRPAAEGIEIGFPLSRQDLAELAGTTLHTASRIMSGWEDRNLVSGGRRRVVLRDRQGLERLAG